MCVAVLGFSRSVPANIRECQQLSRGSGRKSLGLGQNTFNTTTSYKVTLFERSGVLAAAAAGWMLDKTIINRAFLTLSARTVM